MKIKEAQDLSQKSTRKKMTRERIKFQEPKFTSVQVEKSHPRFSTMNDRSRQHPRGHITCEISRFQG